MTYRTLVPSTLERYLVACEGFSADERAAQICERDERLLRFPHPLILELSFAELDFAIRWCWHHFGLEHGECNQKYSEYRVCMIEMPHCHTGKWTTYWFEKTDYNFGFNEWYFVDQSDRDFFRANLSQINWGENIPSDVVRGSWPNKAVSKSDTLSGF